MVWSHRKRKGKRKQNDNNLIKVNWKVRIKNGVVLVKMFVNVPKLAHVVVATLDDRVDVRDKVKI